MANRRLQERRAGLKRKGPRGRAEDYNAMRESLRDGEAERQCKHRQLLREREEEARLLALVEDDVEVGREVQLSSHEISLVLSEIVDFFTEKLQGFTQASSRLKIMEWFLEDERIFPFLPKYYPRRQDAIAQFEFLKNYQLELDAVKGVHLADMLARKAVLLHAAISSTVTSTTTLSCVLKIHPSNLREAITRRNNVRCVGTTFALVRRKKRPGLSDESKDLMLKWWTEETRVSPNRKDIVQKWMSPNTYDQHCTHYLLESQVRRNCRYKLCMLMVGMCTLQYVDYN